MKNITTKLYEDIENASVSLFEEKENRGHLGASQIGDECRRKTWYAFRWFANKNFSPRVLRLLQRGHSEEEKIIKLLEESGLTVKNEQSKFSDLNGHFAGSCDGQTTINGIDYLLEFKTSNDKNFKDLQSNKVKKSKPQHFIQMQIYMHYFKLKHALYIVVNKNDDDIYLEIIQYDKLKALSAIMIAQSIIEATEAPAMISNNATYYKCKWCDFFEVCKLNKPKLINCRSCIHSTTSINKSWICEKYKIIIPVNKITKGCKSHE